MTELATVLVIAPESAPAAKKTAHTIEACGRHQLEVAGQCEPNAEVSARDRMKAEVQGELYPGKAEEGSTPLTRLIVDSLPSCGVAFKGSSFGTRLAVCRRR
jgi:hypothetical protein